VGVGLAICGLMMLRFYPVLWGSRDLWREGPRPTPQWIYALSRWVVPSTFVIGGVALVCTALLRS
jgi:hypothetical protein